MEDKVSLTVKMFLAMVLGLATGLFIQYLSPNLYFLQSYLIDGLFHITGTVFIASLKMLVVPLVLVSLVCGASSLHDSSRLGRLGIKTAGLYLLTTGFAVTLALISAVLVRPGMGGKLDSVAFHPQETPKLSSVLMTLIPDNPIRAMAEGNMLQLIVFALLFGIAISHAGRAGERVAALFNDLNEIIMKLVLVLMNIAPYGVFCLMAELSATSGFETMGNLASYFLVVLFVLVLQASLVYPLMLIMVAGLSPITFYSKMRPAMLFAFSTASSNATLPVTLETATKHLGIRNSVASFTIPLGATVNMDGTAIMQGVATVFIAQVYNIDLNTAQYLSVIVTATLASIGTAGVPGVGLIMLAMVLRQVGLPVEGIALIIGVDRLLDMTRTVVNICGDCAVSCIVAKSEGEFAQEIYDTLTENS